MILEESEAADRLSSEHNLVNRLKRATSSSRSSKEAMEIFGITEPSPTRNPVLPPSAEELVTDIQAKLKMGLAHDSAVEVLYDSVEMLRRNLVNMDPSHPERLAKVAFEMGRVISTVDEVRSGNKHSNAPTIIYKPVMLNETNYEIIQVHE